MAIYLVSEEQIIERCWKYFAEILNVEDVA